MPKGPGRAGHTERLGDMNTGTDRDCYIYMVRCRDGSIYTGWTTELDRRIAQHNSGKGAKYTKSRRPVELVYYEKFGAKQEAMRREAEIKKMTRKQKIKLIEKSKKSD